MTPATKKRKTWLCMKCGHRNELRTSSRKCQNPDCLAPDGKRKKPERKHKAVLRTMGYEDWAALSVMIHGGELYACGVCQRPPKERRNNDRDHDHRTGLARGLACPRCNKELLRHSTLEEARAVVAYLERVEAFRAGSQ